MTLRIGHTYAPSEMARLASDRLPAPLEPHRPNPGRRPLARLAADGTRWCPFCNTVLPKAGRLCGPCREAPPGAVPNLIRGGGNAAPNRDDLVDLLQRVDTMVTAFKVVARRAERVGEVREGEALEDLFMACKDVEVAAAAVRDDAP